MSIEPINPYYYPTYHQITAITNSFPAAVTTYAPHGYVTGTIISIVIPGPYTVRGNYYNFGMNQINGLQSSITIPWATTFTCDAIDSTMFYPFVVPAGVGQQPQCIPIGEINSIITAATVNIL